MAALRRLKVLRLDGNLLLKIEPRELSGCSQLTSLDISGNKLDNISVRARSHCAETNQNITRNTLGPAYIKQRKMQKKLLVVIELFGIVFLMRKICLL